MAVSSLVSATLPMSSAVLPVVAAPRSRWWSASAWASFWAGFLTLFTISIVGELPIGELVLFAAAGWAVLCAVLNGAWPGSLFRRRWLAVLLAAQLVALVAYIASDLYRHSSPHDMARGWSRMIFLGVDVVAIAYLFGCWRGNLIVFVAGQALGQVTSALAIGPMFGDMWKFGVGAPLSYLIFLVAPLGGALATFLAAAGIGAAHFLLDYRSFGALCIAAGAFTLLQKTRPAFRLWLAPIALAATIAAVFWVYDRTQARTRTTRSDIERAAMVQAAVEAIESSPVVGHGSWFSNSDVYDNFMRIRLQLAREAHVGGFADPNRETDAMALHSQILVAVAEGGIFGGAFFLVFGAGLLTALLRTIILEPWHRRGPLHVLLLLSALWNLLFSPFSGAHRVYIAMACGLILLLQSPPSPGRQTRFATQ